MTERDRAQLCIHLGEGDTGRALRARLEQAASLRGASLSTWCRWALDEVSAQCLGRQPAHAGGDKGLVSLSRLEALEERVRRLEAQVRI